MRKGEGTKFTIDRKIFSSDIWYASPWKLKIWVYLLGHANYKGNEYMGVDIKRGQVLRSYRTIAKDCGYKIGYRLKKPSISTVRRICEELMKDKRMTMRTVQLGTLFTITNYNMLQPFLNSRRKQRTTQEENSSRTIGEQDKKDIRKTKEIKHICVEIFSFWKNQLNHPKALLTKDRQTKISARLKEGYTIEQCKNAIEGCKLSVYHMGDNPQGTIYDSIELIFRNGDKIEQFINIYKEVLKHGKTGKRGKRDTRAGWEESEKYRHLYRK